MQNLINALLNTLLVSIPEEFVWVVLTLIFLKRFDLLDWRRWKENLKWILIPVVPTSILINILRYIITIPKPFMTLICTIVLVILLRYIVSKTSFIDTPFLTMKCILFSIVSVVIIMFIESIYIPIVLFLTHSTINVVNGDPIISFLYSLPSRVFQVIVLIIVINKVYNGVNENILIYLFKDKFASIISITVLSSSIIFWAGTVIMFGNLNIFSNFSIQEQLAISAFILIVPTVFIGIFALFISYHYSSIVKLSKSHQNMFDVDIDNTKKGDEE